MQPFVDIHCHLVPGIDDGAASLDDSLAMARMAVEDGIGVVICTPHQLGNYQSNSGDLIRQRVRQLQEQLDASGIPLQVLPGGDVRIEAEMIPGLKSGQVMSLADKRKHVLLELPHELYFPLDDVLQRLRKLGMQGILSHPERNRGLLADWPVVEQLVDQGCLMQVTAGSLHGTFGAGCQKMAQWMVERNLAHIVATDAHSPKTRRPLMARAYEAVAALRDKAAADQACCTFPAAVARGETISIPERFRSRTRGFSWLPWRRTG